MSVLVIGGDKINKLESFLKTLGVEKTHHWDSRRNSTSHKQLPQKTDAIIMMIDFLKHNSMNHFKREAKKLNIPFLCIKGQGGCNECQISQLLDGIKNNLHPICSGRCK